MKTRKHAELKGAFPGKKLVRFYNMTKEGQLSFTERVVWSRLVWLATKGDGATRASLARSTGFSTGRTIPRSLKTLQDMNLIGKVGERYFALEPDPERAPWFVRRQGIGQSWSQQLCYQWLILPGDDLTLREAAIYAHCWHAKGRTSINKLKRLLGVSGSTICKYLSSLRSKHLLLGRYTAVISSELLLHFQDVDKAAKSTVKLKAPTEINYGSEWWHELKDDIFPSADPAIPIATGRQLIAGLNEASRMMQAAGYTRKQIEEYWDKIEHKLKDDQWLVFVADFKNLFSEVDADHRRNGYKGTSVKLLMDNSLTKIGSERFRTSCHNVHRFGGLVFQ